MNSYNPRRTRFSKNTIQTSRKGQNRSTGLYGRLRGICQKSDFEKVLKNRICLHIYYKYIRK